MKMNLSVVKAVGGSLVFKMGTAVVSFLCVPLLIKILGTSHYGLWVTLTGLIGWLNLFDFGSGYSLKNRISETIVTDDEHTLTSIIAGTIQFYILSCLLITIVFGISLYYVDIFSDNKLIAIILYLPVILSFPLTLGHFMLQGLKRFNQFNSLLLGQSILWLLITLLGTYGVLKLNIVAIAGVYSGLYVLVNLIIFSLSLRSLKFQFTEVMNLKHFGDSRASLIVGGRFFLLQVSSLLLFSIGNILTYNYLGASDVARFDTVNKIFLMGMLLFNVLISVYWAEISQAKAQKDKVRLLLLYKQLLFISTIFSVGSLGVLYFIPAIVTFWTKGIIEVNTYQLLPFVGLLIIQMFSYAGAVFLNAFEDLTGQTIFAVAASILIIPIARYLFLTKMGIGSVPLASSIVLLPGLFYLLYKARKCILQVDND